jgi:hypothetical protein
VGTDYDLLPKNCCTFAMKFITFIYPIVGYGIIIIILDIIIVIVIVVVIVVMGKRSVIGTGIFVAIVVVASAVITSG